MAVNVMEILLVEDDPDDIELIKEAFKAANIVNNIIVLRDGQEALDYLFHKGDYTDVKKSEMPGLILLDIKMPKVDGIEVLKKIKKDRKLKRIPVVMLTTSQDNQDILESYDNHANSYIEKPVHFDDFIKVIKEIGLYWILTNTPPVT